MPLPATRGTDSNFFTQAMPNAARVVQMASAQSAQPMPTPAQISTGWGKVINDLYVQYLKRPVTLQEMYGWSDKMLTGAATPATIASALQSQAALPQTSGPGIGANTPQPGEAGTWFQGVFYPSSGPGPPQTGPPIEKTPYSPPSPTPPDQQRPNVPNPWTINPAVWDSLGPTGQQLALGFAEKSGWDANDYTRQINATRPLGSAQRGGLTAWEQPRNPWAS